MQVRESLSLDSTEHEPLRLGCQGNFRTVGKASFYKEGGAVNAETKLRRAAERARKASAEHETARQWLIAAVIEARQSGMTLEAIGDIVGVTRQRVRQIVREAGLR